MFFNAGTYTATNGANALTLNNGQSVWGRSANYSAPASSPTQPIFNGAFILSGNNILDSIVLNNSLGVNTTAITSTGGQNLIINNTIIGNPGNPYGTALNLTNSGATLSGSSANLFSAVGVSLSGTSSLLVQSSNLSLVGNGSAIPEGFLLANTSSLTFNNSQLTVTNISNSTPTDGILATNNATATINNSVITVNGNPNTASAGLVTFNGAAQILMNGNNLVLFGSQTTSSPRSINGGNILVGGSLVCQLNGSIVPC
jgi:hypothetical protein